MFKNTASQKLIVYAFDSTTNLPKTGDAANQTAYVSKDFGAVTVLGDTSATEMDATNAKGYYLFDLTQAETNADVLLFSAKSSTANIVVLGMPSTVFTTPANFTKLVIDSSGLTDANAVKVGPSGSGTAQTARDLGASVLLSAGTGTGQLDFTSGVVKANLAQILGTALTETAGQIAGGFKKFFNIATPAATMDHGVLVDTVTTATTATTATNLTNAPTAGDFTATMKTSIGTAVAASAVASVTGNVGGNVVGSVGSVTGAVGSVTGAVGSVTGAVGSVTGAVGSVTGNVGGNVTGSVGSIASGGITDASFAAGTGKKVVRANTAAAGAGSTITFDASASATDNIYNGCLVYLTGGTGVGQSRAIIGYVGSTQVATVDRAWQTNPDNTTTFAILPADTAKLDSSLRTTDVGSGVVTTNNDKTGYALTAAYDAAKTASQAGDIMKVSSGTGANQISLSSGQVIAASVSTGGISAASYAANAITSSVVATDAITSAQLATTAVNEIRDAILSDSTAFAGASIAAIKAKTDNLPEGIKKNTALAKFEFFMADSADHVTGKTGLTITGTKSIDGGAFSGLTNSPVEVASGVYYVDLAAGDLNGTVITLKFTATGADATLITIKTTL